MRKEDLLEEIEAAFIAVPRPRLSLRQLQLTDEKGMAGEISEEEWQSAGATRTDQTWREIADAELEECGCLLPHMSDDEFLYYLPAYLHHSIRHLERPIWKGSLLVETIFCLSVPYPNGDKVRDKEYQFSRLTVGQVKAIISFLRFLGSASEERQRADAMIALQYWLMR